MLDDPERGSEIVILETTIGGDVCIDVPIAVSPPLRLSFGAQAE